MKYALLNQLLSAVKRIFFIDDDEDEHYLFRKAIRETGFIVQCKCFAYGVDALRYMGLNIPDSTDLIVLDINMPRMNGKEFLIHLSGILGENFPPVLVQSNSASEWDVKESQKLGARFYLQKRTYRETIAELKALFRYLDEGIPLSHESKIYIL
jgi:CheY-like chemotaxis protein